MGILTAKERKTLNDAMAIIQKHTAHKTSLHLSNSHFEGCNPSWDLCFFASDRSQYSGVRGPTLADKIEATLQIEASVEKDAEVIKQRKIDRLRAELAAMESAT